MTCTRFPHGIICNLTERVVDVTVKGKLYQFKIGKWGGGWVNQDGTGRTSPVPRAAWKALDKALKETNDEPGR